jgi:transcription antitermination factor NusG
LSYLLQIADCGALACASARGRDREREWYAVYTSPCHEKQIAEHLAVRQIEHFLPLYGVTRRWKDGRTVMLEMALFPSYLFVHACRVDRTRILGTPGILSIVGTSRDAIALPTAEIESLRNGLHLHNAKPHPFLSVGERARIRRGPLAGLQGIILRQKNSARIVLTLDLIMKSVALEIDLADLEPLGTAFCRQSS